MSEPSRPNQSPNIGLMPSVEDSPAKTYRRAERCEDSPESEVDYGLNSRECFASYDLASSSWRTSQRSLFSPWESFCGTWPTSGLMRSGKCYPLAPLVPNTYGDECLWLPTPMASDGKSYYVVSRQHALKRLAGENGTQIHLIHIAVALSGLSKGFLNPQFVEAAMGFPCQWTDLEDLETPSCPKSPNTSVAA